MLNRLESIREFLLPPNQTQPRPTPVQAALWAGVVILLIVLSLWHYDSFQVGAIQDDAEYVILARSLVHADQYGMANTPGQPAPTRFPFGFPLALSAVEAVLPFSLTAMKVLSFAATLLNVGLLFWGWRCFSHTLSHWWALAATALYSLSPLTVGQTRGILSEPLFTTWLLTALLLTELIARQRLTSIGSLALGVVWVLMTFTRTIGVAAVVASIAYMLFTRKQEALKSLVLAAFGAGLTLVMVVAFTKVQLRDLLPSDYLNQFSSPATWGQTQIETSLVDRFFGAVQEYGTQHIRSLILPVGGGSSEQTLADRLGLPFLPTLFGWVFSILVGLGAVLLLIRERSNAFFVVSVLYIGVIILWPWRGPRFLYAIQPQVFIFFLFAWEAIALTALHRLRRTGWIEPQKMSAGLLTALILFLLSVSVVKNAGLDDSRWHTGDLQLRTDWIRQQTPPGSVILSDNPAVDFIYGDRPTVRWVAGTSPDDFNEFLDQYHVNYVLIAPDVIWQSRYNLTYSNNTSQALSQLTQLEKQGRAHLVHESEAGDVKIFQITH